VEREGGYDEMKVGRTLMRCIGFIMHDDLIWEDDLRVAGVHPITNVSCSRRLGGFPVALGRAETKSISKMLRYLH